MSQRSTLTRVADALARYLDRSGLGDQLEAATVVDDWADRVGPRIAAVAEPVHIADGVLVVAVRSSPWLMELRMMEADIRRRVNEGRERGRVKGIRFVMARAETPGRPRGRYRKDVENT